MGSFLQGLYKKGAKLAGQSANSIYGGMSANSMSWSRAIGGDALRGVGSAMKAVSRSPLASSMTTGAIGGGMYGALDRDTSVLGGALQGAMLGGAALGASRLGRTGLSAYRGMRGMGYSAGRAASASMAAMGQSASSYIGTNLTRAANGFSAMRSRFRR